MGEKADRRRWILLGAGMLFVAAVLTLTLHADRGAVARPGSGSDARTRGDVGSGAAAAAAWTRPALLPTLGSSASSAGSAEAGSAGDDLDAQTGVYTNLDYGNGRYYDPRDLAVLSDIIERNQLGEHSSPFDHDDGDGVFEPWELGYQEWRFGRLVALHLGPDRYATAGYEIAELPETISDLDALRVLDLHSNQLAELPAEIGQLGNLVELRLFRNQLADLPLEIGRLHNLEILVLGGNQLAELPPTLGDLRRLDTLHVNDNPLTALPEGLSGLVNLRLLNVSHGDADASPVRLTELPGSLADLPRLSVLLVGGNSLFCEDDGSGGPVLSLLTDGTISVQGLRSQRCFWIEGI